MTIYRIRVPHIKEVTATQVRHRCTGKLLSFHHGWWWSLALQSPLTCLSVCAYNGNTQKDCLYIEMGPRSLQGAGLWYSMAKWDQSNPQCCSHLACSINPTSSIRSRVQTQITAGPESLWHKDQLNHKMIGKSKKVASPPDNLSVSYCGIGLSCLNFEHWLGPEAN